MCLFDRFSLCPSFRTFFKGTLHYYTTVVPVDLLKFPEFKSMGDDHSEIIMIDYIFRSNGIAYSDGL